MGTGQTKGSVSPDYILDNASEQTGARFRALSEIFDAGTIRHLSDRGVDEGWHCLEVGGGNGSVASWLSRRVGPTGRVVVTDIDTRFLETLRLPNVEVLRHNVVTDALPEGAFDLVHSRLVLLHLPQRDQALRRMIAALKPGGWLVDEEFDSTSLIADPANPREVSVKTHCAMVRLMQDHGVETRYGRLLPGRLRAHGLVEVSAEARTFLWQGGSPGASLLQANFQQLRREIIKAGYTTEEEFERDCNRLKAPDFLTVSPPMWAAWGCRPRAWGSANTKSLSLSHKT